MFFGNFFGYLLALVGFALCTQESAAASSVGGKDIVDYIDLALVQDQRIAQARAQVAANQAAEDAANAPRRPQVGVSGSYSWNNQLKPLARDYASGEAALDVQQSLWQRSLLSQRDLARMQTEASQLRLASAKQQLLRELSTTLFDYLNQRRVVAAYQAQQQVLANALAREEARFAVGASSLPRITAVRAELHQVKASLLAVQALQDNYLDVLQRIVGEPVMLPPVTDSPQFAMPEEDRRELQTRARKNNLELRLAQNAIAQADLNITLAQPINHLSVDLFGRWSQGTNPNGQGMESEMHQLGVRLKMPLYTGGRVAAYATKAEQEYAAAQLARDYQASVLTSTVRLRWRELQAQLAVIEANQLSVLSATQSLELNQAAYDNNALDQQELLDAQSRLYNAERILVDSQFAFSRQMVALYELAGELHKERLSMQVRKWW